MFAKIMGGIMCLSFLVFATPPEQVFLKANQLYKAEQYRKALEQYVSIEKSAPNGILFYNIGNCQVKLGNWVQAKYYYDKASDYMPADRDLRFNLEWVNRQFRDNVEEQTPLWIHWYSMAINAVPLEMILWTALSLLSLGTTLVLLYRFGGRWFTDFDLKANIRLIFPGYLILCIFLFGLFSPRIQWMFPSKSALVFADRVEVRSGPDDKFATLFVLHQGTKVKLKEVAGNWVSLEASSQLQGWAPLDAFGRRH